MSHRNDKIFRDYEGPFTRLSSFEDYDTWYIPLQTTVTILSQLHEFLQVIILLCILLCGRAITSHLLVDFNLQRYCRRSSRLLSNKPRYGRKHDCHAKLASRRTRCPGFPCSTFASVEGDGRRFKSRKSQYRWHIRVQICCRSVIAISWARDKR